MKISQECADEARKRRRTEASYRLFRAKHGDSNSEARRLKLFERCFDATTRRNLRSIPVESGWKILEVAAGQGSVAAWIAGIVGESGSVIATDVAFNSDRSPDVARVEYLQHDAARDPFPERQFDCIHVRSALHLMTRREAVVEGLVESLRPGGWLLVEELDVDPAIRSGDSNCSRVWSAMQEQSSLVGVDLKWVKHLQTSLRLAGLEGVDIQTDRFDLFGGSNAARLWGLTFSRARDLIIPSGLPIEAFDAALRELVDPGFRSEGPALVSALGRRPKDAG